MMNIVSPLSEYRASAHFCVDVPVLCQTDYLIVFLLPHISAVRLLQRPNTNPVTAFCRPPRTRTKLRGMCSTPWRVTYPTKTSTMMNKTMYYQMPIYNDEQTGSITWTHASTHHLDRSSWFCLLPSLTILRLQVCCFPNSCVPELLRGKKKFSFGTVHGLWWTKIFHAKTRGRGSRRCGKLQSLFIFQLKLISIHVQILLLCRPRLIFNV